MGLRVNHGHAARSNCDVVNVRVTVAGHAAIMQQTDSGSGQELLEACADPDLTVAALLPGARAGWLVDHLGGQPAHGTELLTRVPVASIAAAFVFAQCACAWLTGIDWHRLRGCDRAESAHTFKAGDSARGWVPPRRRSDCQIYVALPAPVRSAEGKLSC